MQPRMCGIKQDYSGRFYMITSDGSEITIPSGSEVAVAAPVQMKLEQRFEKVELPINEETGLPVKDDGTFYIGGFDSNRVANRCYISVLDSFGAETHRLFATTGRS